MLCAGLAFFLAGVAIAIQTLGNANATGELPAEAPRWMRVVQYLIGFTIFCFGAIASWVAFGPGERHFSETFVFGDAATNAAIGRTAFGVGGGHHLALHRCRSGVRHPQVFRRSRQAARGLVRLRGRSALVFTTTRVCVMSLQSYPTAP